MNIDQITEKAKKVAEQYAQEFNIEYTEDWFVMKLQEEFGEMVQQHLIRTHRTRRTPESDNAAKEALAEEIADVFCYVLLFAKWSGISVEQAVTKKWFKYLKEPSEKTAAKLS